MKETQKHGTEEDLDSRMMDRGAVEETHQAEFALKYTHSLDFPWNSFSRLTATSMAR